MLVCRFGDRIFGPIAFGFPSRFFLWSLKLLVLFLCFICILVFFHSQSSPSNDHLLRSSNYCQEWLYFSELLQRWFCFDEATWLQIGRSWVSKWFLGSLQNFSFETSPSQSSHLAFVTFLVAPHYFSQMSRCITALEMNFLSFYRYPVVIFHSDNVSKELLEVVKLTRSHVTFQWIAFRPIFSKGSHLPHAYGYLHMCRFFSSRIWFHPVTSHFNYVMRLDPHSFIASPMPCDPFLLMKRQSKRYGFSFLWVERADYSEGLFALTRDFGKQFNFSFPMLFLELFIQNHQYNLFQIYNNFFLAETELFRDPLVAKYLRFIDQSGGHYKTRWGDSLVHSFVVGLFLEASQILVLTNFSYVHARDFRCHSIASCKLVDEYIGKPRESNMEWIDVCNVRMVQFKKQCMFFRSVMTNSSNCS